SRCTVLSYSARVRRRGEHDKESENRLSSGARIEVCSLAKFLPTLAGQYGSGSGGVCIPGLPPRILRFWRTLRLSPPAASSAQHPRRFPARECALAPRSETRRAH